jgi:hypothetical protein
LTDKAVRLEFHVRDDLDGLTLDTLTTPPREPDTARFASMEEMADGIEARVMFHLSDHQAMPRLILFSKIYGRSRMWSLGATACRSFLKMVGNSDADIGGDQTDHDGKV